MKIARIMMLGLALAAGGTALVIMSSAPPQVEVREAVRSAPQPEMDEILVASIDLAAGKAIADSDLAWQKWPLANIQPGMISRRNGEAAADLRGAYVRLSMAAGDPIRREKLIRTGRGSGFLAANLQPGLRAVAIPIDAQGLSSAGGFIQPNDRVDVVRISRDEDGRNFDAQSVQTILLNARVLAIGQNAGERGERALNATTATLEVTPEQGEMLIQAQRTAQLTLALRPLADPSNAAGSSLPEREGIATVVRFGILQGGK